MAVDGLEQNFSLESEISPKRGLKPGSGGEGDPDFDSRFGGGRSHCRWLQISTIVHAYNNYNDDE